MNYLFQDVEFDVQPVHLFDELFYKFVKALKRRSRHQRHRAEKVHLGDDVVNALEVQKGERTGRRACSVFFRVLYVTKCRQPESLHFANRLPRNN